MGFDFIVIAPLLLPHCGFSFAFGCGVSFLVSSSVFLSMIVQQLVVILVFSQEGVGARPSTHGSYYFSSFHAYFHFPIIDLFIFRNGDHIQENKNQNIWINCMYGYTKAKYFRLVFPQTRER